jgi:chaperone modulatory protein CbpM
MNNEIIALLSGVVVEEEHTLSLDELCQCCSLPAEQLISMVEYGVVDPIVVDPIEGGTTSGQWTFSCTSIFRVRTALRLQRDLDVNLAGAALALELMGEIKVLRQHVTYLKRS